jgi:hypothetical protein
VGRRGHSRSELIYWAICFAALCVAAVPLVGEAPTGGTAALVLSEGTAANLVGARTALVPVRHSLPRHLAIPSIGVSTSVGQVGLQANRQVMVPTSVHTVSWYRYGPTPGEIGSAVILGHVDSYVGPAVFFRLKQLRVGDLLTVVLADRVSVRFAVTKVVQYAKASFPDRLVYGSHGTRSLNLVTCGGVFDHATGHYESNIVVFSRLVSVSPPAGR